MEKKKKIVLDNITLAPNTDNQDKTNKINKKQNTKTKKHSYNDDKKTQRAARQKIWHPKTIQNPNINMLSCKYDAHKTCFLKI